jgi:uncharacterized SAM-binding protein YcdF (DUF218 family)
MEPDLLLRAICRSLVLPPGGPILLGLVGLLVLGRWPRTGRWLIGAGLGLLLALSMPVLAYRLAAAAERYPMLDAAHLPPAEVIVVLGGGLRRSSAAPEGVAPGAVTLERLAYAAELERRTGLPLLLSGGIVDSPQAEAIVMAHSLSAQFGIEARWLETRSRTTEENARESAALLRSLGLTRVLLVTSADHMRRSVAEFRAAGIEPIPAPAAGGATPPHGARSWLPSANALSTSYSSLYELAGEAVAWLRGRR